MDTQQLTASTEIAVFGGGCFWCLDAVFSALQGVRQVTCGYTGGQTNAPTYADICTGTTGHAEVVAIDFDPAVMSFERLLAVFFATHDATTLNRQGNDRGTQYRSVIYYQSQAQHLAATTIINSLQPQYAVPIVTEVTEVTAATTFYPAEAYHQQYFAKNPEQGYCQLTIPPKLAKLRELFAGDL